MENSNKDEKNLTDKSSSENSPRSIVDYQNDGDKDVPQSSTRDSVDEQSGDDKNVAAKSDSEFSSRDTFDGHEEVETNVAHEPSATNSPIHADEVKENDKEMLTTEMESLNVSKDSSKNQEKREGEDLVQLLEETKVPSFDNPNEMIQTEEEMLEENEADPVFDGTEDVEPEGAKSPSRESLDLDMEASASAWPGKAAAIKNYVKVKGAVAVSSVLRRLSGKKDEDSLPGEEENSVKEEDDSGTDTKQREASPKTSERSTWNPLNYIKIVRDTDFQNKQEGADDEYVEKGIGKPVMKGRIIVYTRLECQECKDVRLFLRHRGLTYVEINIDIYPSRKLELERNTGSSTVPRVYFNDFLVGGLSELKAMNESGKLVEKIDAVINEEPSPAAPWPPLSGEDDETGSGKIDELASIVRKMKESIIIKDRFYKMRKFNNCFLGSEAVDFLSEDQYLEREEAVEFGRMLANKHFFRHIKDENVFEDGNNFYRFLEHDPIVTTQCYNISWGTIDVKPKPINDIASRLRFLSFAIFEAYVAEDGQHVDYRSIHSSEEFQRYLRIVEELQRVDVDGLSREEKLSFFINLYNMMAIHAILTWVYPDGALDRKKFLGDFKYVVGGCTYSLSAIQNGILRGNQRPPYNLMKPFGPKDKRFKVALPFPEPLVHFALVCGARSGPSLRCYSPGNIDQELMEAARDFLRNGGLVVDPQTKVASLSRILLWYSVDFGKTEVEVLKHAANYLEPERCEELLELLATTQLKVIYQPYDWSLNC